MFKVGDKVRIVREGRCMAQHHLMRLGDKDREVVDIGRQHDRIYDGLIKTREFGKADDLGWWHAPECCDIIPVPVGDKEWKEAKAEVKVKRVRKPKVEWVPITMSNLAKKGDKVLCIIARDSNVAGLQLVDGEEYEVDEDQNNLYNIYIKNVEGRVKAGFHSERFHVQAVPIKKDKVAKKAAIMNPKKEKSRFQFEIGDRVRLQYIDLPDQPAGGRIDNDEFQNGKIFTIGDYWAGSGNNDGKPVGYYLKEDCGAHRYVWDERFLKRVRKAQPKNVIKDVIKAAKAKARVKKEKIIKPVEYEMVVCTYENTKVGGKVICVVPDGGEILVKDKEYTVSDLKPHRYAGFLISAAPDRHFYPHRFAHKRVKEQAIIPKASVVEKEKLDTSSHHYDLLAGLAKEADAHAGTCSYAIKFKDGHIQYQARDVCHLRLGGQGGHGQRIACALNIKGHYVNMKEENKPRYLRYVNYVINESPFKNVFLSRGVNHALKHGILMNVERPIEEIAGAAITLRQASEYWQARLKFFCDLLDKGYSGNTAYLLMYAVNDKQQFFGFDDGHRSIAQDCDAQDVIKTFRDGYHLTGHLTAYNKSSQGYEGVAKFIGKRQSKETITEYFRKGLKVGKMGGGVGWGSDKGGDKVSDENLYAFADKLELLVNKIV